MLKELRDDGLDCRFLRELKHGPMWKLKPAVRGGQKGGARVYLFMLATRSQAGLVNCELKKPDGETDQTKLEVGLQVVQAYKRGINVVMEPIHGEDVEGKADAR